MLLFKTTAILAFWSFLDHVAANQRNDAIRVKSGQSIQAAINAAHRGDRIIVEAGTYAEQLTITTSGISLIGRDAVIVPPTTPTSNTCSDLAGPGTQAGICIAGKNVILQDLSQFDGEHRKVTSVGTYVKDVSVSGFTIQGFIFGLNIAVVGAQNACINSNTASSASNYGILTVGSKSSNIAGNTVLSVPGGPFPVLGPFFPYFIGICMDDTSTVDVAHNDISGYFIGLCVQTAGANIHDNNVHDVCVGAFVDPGNDGARLHDNTFTGSVPADCPAIPKYSSGITISGATNTLVRGNRFIGIKNTGQAAGVAVLDNMDDTTGATTANASGNKVQDNWFKNNDLDILDTATGAGNVVRQNQCKTSNPTGLCN